MRRRLIGLMVLAVAAPAAVLAAARKGSKRVGGTGKSGKGSHYVGGTKGAAPKKKVER